MWRDSYHLPQAEHIREFAGAPNTVVPWGSGRGKRRRFPVFLPVALLVSDCWMDHPSCRKVGQGMCCLAKTGTLTSTTTVPSAGRVRLTTRQQDRAHISLSSLALALLSPIVMRLRRNLGGVGFADIVSS